jgi:hypothetical protein
MRGRKINKWVAALIAVCLCGALATPVYAELPGYCYIQTPVGDYSCEMLVPSHVGASCTCAINGLIYRGVVY